MIASILGAVLAAQLNIEVLPEPDLTPPLPESGVIHVMDPIGKNDQRYKLRLPGQYKHTGPTLFPLLILHNPGGNTNLKPYEAWAEQNGVILVGIDGIRNGLEQHKKNPIADGVLKDLVERSFQVHPTLRFTIGMSGGSADGMRLIRRKPGSYAGAVLMGAGGILLDRPDSAHLAYAILGGAKDEWMPGDACYNMAEKGRSNDIPVRLEVDVDRQHQEAPLPRQLAALTWLLELQKLRLPSLSAEERTANLAAARQRLSNVGEISDPATQRAELELLLRLGPLRQFTNEWASLVALDAKLNPPRALSPLEERYRAAEEREARAGINPALLTEVLPVWEGLAKDAAGTEWEPKIARRIQIVKIFIETPSTIQKPTRVRL